MIILSSIDTNKSLIENSDYLKRLALELKDKKIEDIDSNLLYEVAYADTYLDVLLSKSSDKTLNSELLDSKAVFDIILSSAPYDKVNDLKSSFDYKKLLKCKYDDIDKASYSKSYATPVQDFSGALIIYLRSVAPSFIVIALVSLFLLSGGIDLIDKLIPSITPAVDSLFKLFKILISLCFTAMLILRALGISLDLLYIIFPFIRLMLPDDKQKVLFSSQALECCFGEAVVYKQVRGFNRIERNKVWLDTMIEVLSHDGIEKEEVCSEYNTTISKTEIYKSLTTVKERLDLLESSKRKRKEYYLLMAKIEFLHDKYLQLI